MAPDLLIRHLEDKEQFVVTVDGHDAVLSYGRVADGVLDYRSTYVPPVLRRRGIASALVRHGLDFARANGLRVLPTCWFVAKVLDEDVEYRDLTAG